MPEKMPEKALEKTTEKPTEKILCIIKSNPRVTYREFAEVLNNLPPATFVTKM